MAVQIQKVARWAGHCLGSPHYHTAPSPDKILFHCGIFLQLSLFEFRLATVYLPPDPLRAGEVDSVQTKGYGQDGEVGDSREKQLVVITSYLSQSIWQIK